MHKKKIHPHSFEFLFCLILGRVKSLPNYRIDKCFSATNSSSDEETMNVDEEPSLEPEINEESFESEVINDNPEMIDEVFSCVLCHSEILRDELVSHTESCLLSKFLFYILSVLHIMLNLKTSVIYIVSLTFRQTN